MALWIMGFGGTVPIGVLVAGAIENVTSITAVLLGGLGLGARARGLVVCKDPAKEGGVRCLNEKPRRTAACASERPR